MYYSFMWITEFRAGLAASLSQTHTQQRSLTLPPHPDIYTHLLINTITQQQCAAERVCSSLRGFPLVLLPLRRLHNDKRGCENRKYASFTMVAHTHTHNKKHWYPKISNSPIYFVSHLKINVMKQISYLIFSNNKSYITYLWKKIVFKRKCWVFYNLYE